MLSQPLLHFLIPTIFTRTRGLPLTVPGPDPTRFLSTAGAIIPWGNDPLGHATRLFREYGDVVALVRGGGTRTISADRHCPGTVIAYGSTHTRTATAEHDVFGKGILSGALYPESEPSLRKKPLLTFGAGLFSVNGDEHRRHRRLLMPAFSQKRLQAYTQEMVAQTQVELDRWQVGEVRQTADDMRRLTLNIVSRTMFGHVAETQNEASFELQEALRLMGMPLTRIAPFDLWGLPFRAFLSATGRIEVEMRRILADRRSHAEGASDMLSTLLAAHDAESNTRLSETELLGHVSVIFTAGHETSSNALTWTLLLLALFPEVTGRLCEELESVLAKGPPAHSDFERLPYLDAVVKESLRLMTPAPWNGRILRAPARLGTHELPAGTEVLVSIYHTHRVAEIYAEPLAFCPERWESIKPSVYEYNPFSAGPRTCIGASFALLEIKVVLAMVLSRYRMALVPQRVDRFAEMVLTPKHGVAMRVCSPDGNFNASVASVSGNIHDMVKLPS